MAYTRTNWVSGETPLSAGNMNNIEDGIEDLNSKTSEILKIVSYSSNYTVSGNTGKNLTANDFGMSTPSGYRPVAITRFSSGNASVYVRGVAITATGSDGVLYMNNTTSSSVSATAYIQILYAKTSIM